MNTTNRAMLQAKADAKAQLRADESGFAEEWALRLKELRQEVRRTRGMRQDGGVERGKEVKGRQKRGGSYHYKTHGLICLPVT